MLFKVIGPKEQRAASEQQLMGGGKASLNHPGPNKEKNREIRDCSLKNTVFTLFTFPGRRVGLLLIISLTEKRLEEAPNMEINYL